MYLETIVALSLVFSYVVTGSQINLTIQVRRLSQQKGTEHTSNTVS